jgi:hypothetical protein
VTRLMTPVFAVVVGLAFAAPATAQNAPTELWSEYPLTPKVEQAAPSAIGPFLPPGGVESPVTDGSSGTGYWLPLLAVLAIALLVAARFARPLATTGTHVVGRRVAAFRGRTQLRPRPPRRSSRSAGRTRSSGGSPVQYAPITMPAAEVETEALRSLPAEDQEAPGTVPFVTRRSGLVRSRYVVVADDSGRTLRRSKAFWRIGGAAAQQRRAEAAWDDLANGLRADGWELDTAGRYEYYVPLRRAIVATLEVYTRAWPADSDEA